MNEHQLQQAVMEAMPGVIAQMLSGNKATAYKHDAAAANSIAPYSHGAFGLFSTPGQHTNVISAMHLPSAGLLSSIPVMPPGTGLDGTDTDDIYGGEDNPFYTTITGVTAGDVETLANQRATPCGEPPTGGLLKACTLTGPFGNFSVQTRRLDIRQRNRLTTFAESHVEPVSRLLNPAGTTVPSVVPSGGDQVLNEEFTKRVYEAALSLQRYINIRTWIADPANNNAGGGYREFNGMEILVNENNKADAFTGNLCTAMNSYMYDFGNDLVNGTGRDIVRYMDSAFNQLTYQAVRNAVTPVEWWIYMRPEAFDELVKIWPIRYYQEALNQMAAFNNGRVVLTGMETTEMRDDMRNNNFLPIRGRRIRVITDDAIPENNSTNATLPAGRFSSDIYFVPIRILGNFPVFYWETFKWYYAPLFPQESTAQWTTDDRRWLWTKQETRGCTEYTFEVSPRLVLRTPQLAARIQNVAYEPLVHYRTAYPTGDTEDYFFDGGRTNAPFTNVYIEGNTTTPQEPGPR